MDAIKNLISLCAADFEREARALGIADKEVVPGVTYNQFPEVIKNIDHEQTDDLFDFFDEIKKILTFESKISKLKMKAPRDAFSKKLETEYENLGAMGQKFGICGKTANHILIKKLRNLVDTNGIGKVVVFDHTTYNMLIQIAEEIYQRGEIDAIIEWLEQLCKIADEEIGIRKLGTYVTPGTILNFRRLTLRFDACYTRNNNVLKEFIRINKKLPLHNLCSIEHIVDAIVNHLITEGNSFIKINGDELPYENDPFSYLHPKWFAQICKAEHCFIYQCIIREVVDVLMDRGYLAYCDRDFETLTVFNKQSQIKVEDNFAKLQDLCLLIAFSRDGYIIYSHENFESYPGISNLDLCSKLKTLRSTLTPEKYSCISRLATAIMCINIIVMQRIQVKCTTKFNIPYTYGTSFDKLENDQPKNISVPLVQYRDELVKTKDSLFDEYNYLLTRFNHILDELKIDLNTIN